MTGAILFLLTYVWGIYGLGDNWFGTSAGVDQIAQAAKSIPGVAQVRTARWWDMQTVANEIAATPPRSVLTGPPGPALATCFQAVPFQRTARVLNTLALVS